MKGDDIIEEKITYNDKEYFYTGIRYYYISKDGKIISNYRNKIRILKTFLNNDGYERVALKYEVGKEKKYYIHRLVYKVFGKEPLSKDMVIDHIDGNRLNNHIDNLRQCTQQENIINALNHNFGNNNAKPICIINKLTQEEIFFERVKDLIDYTGISIPNGSITKLIKHSKFKSKYTIKYIGKGQQTIENIV